MRVAVVNLTGGGFSGGYRKYLERLVPLLREDRRISVLRVYGLGAPSHGLSEFRPDVVFVPTARWSDFGSLPVVSMVRNMEPLTRPLAGNPPIEAVKNLIRAGLARRACHRSTRVIAVSGHVRDFLVERWRITRSKIGIVEHGVDPPPPEHAAVRPSALPHDVEPAFLFTAGSLRPARGLEDAIRALALVDRRSVPTLVVAGSATRGVEGYAAKMRALSTGLGVNDRIVWAGELTPPEMSWCYRHCGSFVMTSRAEACPNVLLEAMSHGCLCISIRARPMSDMLRDAGLYYARADPASLANQMAAAGALDPGHRAERGEATVARSRCFEWRRTAEQTVGQLEQAVAARC